MSADPEWYESMPDADHRSDLHVFPWPFANDKQHRPIVKCWCGTRRDSHDPRIVIHVPSMAMWEKR